MSTTYEDWVAAGKPCLRQSCGHRHADHVPSEGLECSTCHCLGFIGRANPDDSAVSSSHTELPVTRSTHPPHEPEQTERNPGRTNRGDITQVIVDQNRGIGSGQCVLSTAEAFDQRDEDGIVALVTDKPPPELYEAVRHAGAVCPARAITVLEQL